MALQEIQIIYESSDMEKNTLGLRLSGKRKGFMEGVTFEPSEMEIDL